MNEISKIALSECCNDFKEMIQLNTKIIFSDELKDELKVVEKRFHRQMKKKMWINGGKRR